MSIKKKVGILFTGGTISMTIDKEIGANVPTLSGEQIMSMATNVKDVADFEIKDFDEIIEVINKCDVCRLAINDGDYPYIVPMNFGFNIEDGKVVLYFHCASEGKKLELLRKNNKVAFEMDCGHEFILNDEKMSCTMAYESVMGRGQIQFVEDEDKFAALKIIMKQYHSEDFEFGTKVIPVTTVFKMVVEEMTGKRRKNNTKRNNKKQD